MSYFLKYLYILPILICLFYSLPIGTNGHKMTKNTCANLRNHAVPMISVKGSYYDVGYAIGRTFACLIHENLAKLKGLNEEYIPLYKTDKGAAVYSETLRVVKDCYPQYVRELQGIADGAKVPFYKLFLLHLDDILPNVLSRNATNIGEGCCTVTLNADDQIVIGHNEDGFKETLNDIYMVSVHITEVEPNEIFTAFCYPGLLPGYASGFSKHLAFSIDIIGAKYMASARIPRTFATRALFAASTYEEVEDILRYRGGGVGDAMALNFALFQGHSRPILYNIEVSPAYPLTNQSVYKAVQVERGHYFFHCNKFLLIHNVPEDDGMLKISSDIRHKTKETLPEPVDKQGVLNIIGDHSRKHMNIFRNECDEPVVTLAVVIFDFVANTYSVYRDNPKTADPILVLPLYAASS